MGGLLCIFNYAALYTALRNPQLTSEFTCQLLYSELDMLITRNNEKLCNPCLVLLTFQMTRRILFPYQKIFTSYII